MNHDHATGQGAVHDLTEADSARARLTPREKEHLQWFDANAAAFAEAVAIEVPFLGLGPSSQARLHRLKWWALTTGQLVDWRDRDVLEFGAGHGRLAVEMSGYRSYHGVDYAPNMVRIGQPRLQALGLHDRARIELGDCFAFDAPGESYDVVCGLGLLSYVDDVEALLNKMAYHTRRGGWILADFRHKTALYSMVREVKAMFRPKTTGGAKRDSISKQSLRRILNSAGMVDVRFVMREYPFLDGLYAQRSWDYAFNVREALARRSSLDWLGMIGFVCARKPA